MKITEVTVSSGTTLPHPKYQYGSIREDVSARVLLEDGESPTKAVTKLQEYLGTLLTARLGLRAEQEK